MSDKDSIKIKKVKVIGNIYDNPEVVKMNKEEIIDQLESLRENSLDFAKRAKADGEKESIWFDDIEALDCAIEIIKNTDRLSQIKERLNNATKGPWRPAKAGIGAVVSDYPVSEIRGSEAVEYYGGHLIGESISIANREFIAHAWADIKYLLDIVQLQSFYCKNNFRF